MRISIIIIILFSSFSFSLQAQNEELIGLNFNDGTYLVGEILSVSNDSIYFYSDAVGNQTFHLSSLSNISIGNLPIHPLIIFAPRNNPFQPFQLPKKDFVNTLFKYKLLNMHILLSLSLSLHNSHVC